MTALDEIATGDGAPLFNFGDWREVPAVADQGQLTKPTMTGVSAGRYSIGSHASVIEGGAQMILVSSLQAKGSLRAEISGERFETNIRSGSLSFIPSLTRQHYRYDGSTTSLFVCIDQPLIDRVAASDPRFEGARGLEPRIGFHNAAFQRAVEELFQVMTAADLGWRTLTEAITLRIAYEVLVAFGHASRDDGPPPLAAAELDQVVAFIEAELDRNFTVGEMAELLDRDPFGFIRSFKATTGESPHQFVIQRRLSRAQHLLAQTDDTLADIAFATGFASQSHMTATFTRLVGMPPGKWRRRN
ncbi:MAG: AraC family transcriptional regulator [Pseudomonadota bacterium]